MKAAQTNRDAWLGGKRRRDENRTFLSHKVRAVPTFEGGVIVFLFERNNAKSRYRIVTMFPRPAERTSG